MEELLYTEEEGKRTCGNCEKSKDVSEFYRDGLTPDGVIKYRRDCKECYRVTRLKSRKRPKKADPIPIKRRGRK